ncbi:MAG: hypothetical protein KME17_28525 [Cyanosarcina radialis HA8281-LM2]|nr:hypothetical protein [Cyanosarcina radialis HA8281-LM2]
MGISDVQLWSRPPERLDKQTRRYKGEADIYQEWLRIPQRRTHLLIGAGRDRCLVGSSPTLFVYLNDHNI